MLKKLIVASLFASVASVGAAEEAKVAAAGKDAAKKECKVVADVAAKTFVVAGKPAHADAVKKLNAGDANVKCFDDEAKATAEGYKAAQ